MNNPFSTTYLGSSQLRELGFAEVGENVSIALGCTIVGMHRIRLASNIRIDPNTTIIVSDESEILIGNFVHISGGCHLAAADTIELSDYSGLSQGVSIYTATDDYSGETMTNPMVPAEYKNVYKSPVHLGKHVIVGSGSIILPGVSILDGCSVGALSLVRKSTTPWGVYAGSPARRIAERSRELLKLEAELDYHLKEQK